MPTHTENQYLPYNSRQLFDMVADVEKYPQFLPWCRAARVMDRKENEFLGELVISFHHLTESYVSRVELSPPPDEHAPAAIEVTMVKGPFNHLINRWKFTPEGEGTRIDFFLDFKFRSFILEKLMGSYFTKATEKMVTAFVQRADALYGKKPA